MTMKGKKNLLDLLKPLPYFSKVTVFQFAEQLGLKNTTVDTYISRFLRDKDIAPLKRSFYVTTDFLKKYRSDISYIFYLANIIREPSYVSSWAALQYYDLITDVTYLITSVTPKVTREYYTRAGNFSYYSMKEELFSEYIIVSGKFDYYIASPAKALFDLLYLRTNQFRSVAVKDIKELVDDLRIDIDEMDKEEQNKFYAMVSGYKQKDG